MTTVVWDCETDCSFRSLAGMCRDQQLKVMQATVVCATVFESEDSLVDDNWETAFAASKEYTFWRDDGSNETHPFEPLLALFDAAEVVVAYNGLGFDMPIMRKYYGTSKSAKQRYLEHRMKLFDPMLRVAAATDLPFPKLSNLLEANQVPSKTGDGLLAIQLWAAGKREELREYCANDVRALAQLVHLSELVVPTVGVLPNRVHGIASAILAARAVQPMPMPMAMRPKGVSESQESAAFEVV